MGKKKRDLVQNFQRFVSADSLATFVSGSCSGCILVQDQKHLRIKDFHLSHLRRPDYDALKSNVTNSTSSMDIDNVEASADPGNAGDSPDITMDAGDLPDNMEFGGNQDVVLPATPLPWLDPDCVHPPLPCEDAMPFDIDGDSDGVLFDSDAIGSNKDGNTVLLTCLNVVKFPGSL
jgi:hypothetical protein